MEKSSCRKFFLKKRLALKPSEFKEKSFTIQKRVLQWLDENKIGYLASYISYKNEVDLSFLNFAFFEKSKNLSFPYIESFNREKNREMEFLKVSNFKEDFEKNRLGFTQIKKTCEKMHANDIECMLVPGIVFNEKGYRIGYGQAYYDRFISKFPSQIKKIAIAFDFQLFNFKEDIWDQKLDFLISENFFFKF